MAGIDTAVEWLRPLINNKNKQWDYCVIWKLGDDPSRFIEWGACCCSGGKRPQKIKIKEENGVEKQKHLIAECKDRLIKHPIRTKACEALARLPSAIPLYSGGEIKFRIHGDVVISKQPRWIAHCNASSSDDEPNGTQVLIPVPCGLIELFSSKHVPKDQKIIDYISAHFIIPFKQENMSEKAYTNLNLGEQLPDPYANDHRQNCPPLLKYFNFPPQMSQPNTYSSFEGSSTCSSLSNEHQSLKVASDQVFGSVSEEKISNNLRLKRKNYTDLSLAHNDKKVCMKIRQKPGKGPFKSKNLVTERNRRKRIKDGMFALRALVPKITKMDRAATLGDAAEYIKELHESIGNYNDELREMEEEDHNIINAKTNPPKLIKDYAHKNSDTSEKTPIEASKPGFNYVQIEVNQIGTKDFLLKCICKQKRGGFSRLMEAMNSLGLQVIDANVTAFNGSVLNVFKVEANRTDLEPKILKHSLIQLVN
ncbi:hypothetical protein BUALT_Bualt02G0170200 [Buddleja alternifolia]|uniref:BHLH domain-containing protein n=1 Tax=Buddleja alternifolia TaxID=168488 RepID=A0AAV6Y739_9LAMI|nr:hypothetical protein BUALT_Bualt02G0170200 [Buddleja alternifolia]